MTKLEEFINEILEVMSRPSVPIYNLSEVIKVFQSEGHEVKKLKSPEKEKPEDSYILVFNSPNVPDLAMKVHPDRFKFAREMYNNPSAYEYLSSMGLTPVIQWTGAIKNIYYKSWDIRVTIYNFIDGTNLEEVDWRLAGPMKLNFVSKLNKAGFDTGADYEEFVLTKDKVFGEHIRLTDFNQLYPLYG